MKDLVEKAAVLIEALPYMRRYVGKTIVIKYGGHAMRDEDLRASFALDVVLLTSIGVRPVIVHGGGPQIQDTLDRLGKKSTFVDGLRVTDDETMEVVEMVLGGKVNREIVELVQQSGARAVGLTGSDGAMLRVRPKRVADKDLGRVGEVVSVDPLPLSTMSSAGFVPVLAPIGADEEGRSYNINADEVAGAVACALSAEKLMLVTDIEGVLDTNQKLIPQLSIEEARKYIAEGTIRGGMVPKVECCIEALSGGVSRTNIIDGRILHAILLEIFTDTGVGTQLVP